MSSSVCTVRPSSEILFFDGAEIESFDRVRISVCEAEKHPLNPVLGVGDRNEWDSAQCSPWPVRTVLYDAEEKVFKAWYGGCGHGSSKLADWRMGYALSADGVHWERPSLGLFEFNGSRRNNIIHAVPYGAVIKDLSEADPRKRYKCHMRDFVRYSADGIRWPGDPAYIKEVMQWSPALEAAGNPARVTLRWSGPQAWDLVAFLRDDQDTDPKRRYKIVFQYYDTPNKPGPDKVRFKGLACGPDELHMDADLYSPVLGPNDGFEQENHFLMVIPYKGHWLLLYECGWYAPDGTGKYGRYTADIRLAHSRDGVHFTRLNPDQPVISRGPAGSWDEQFLVISDKAVIKDDTINLYYCGQARDWSSWPPQNAAPRLLEKPGKTALSQMGLATLRLDGFTCLHAGDRASFGAATTRVLTAAEPVEDLALNVSRARPGRDWVQVEVLDASGAPLPGYGRADCAPVCQDALAAPVRWGGKGLGTVGRQAFRLRVHLFGAARLHAVKFGNRERAI